MQSIINLLTFLNDNWTYIVIIVSLAFALYKRGVKLYNNIKKGKIDNTIVIVSNIILEKIAKSEKDWIEYKKTGSIKRSKVINEIYEQYPILKEYIDQEYIISKIDELIDSGIKELEKTLKDIKDKSENNTEVVPESSANG